MCPDILELYKTKGGKCLNPFDIRACVRTDLDDDPEDTETVLIPLISGHVSGPDPSYIGRAIES